MTEPKLLTPEERRELREEGYHFNEANKWIPKLEAHIAAQDVALGKINAIRNSIVGTQNVNWSAHIYPLVAALEVYLISKGLWTAAANREFVSALVQQIREAESAVWKQAAQVAMKTLEKIQEDIERRQTRRSDGPEWRLGELPEESGRRNGAADVWNALMAAAPK